MSAEEIEGLRQAVLGSPGNVSLRARLATALLAEKNWTEALKHSTAILESVPDHLEALRIAQRAAEELGQHETAAGYLRVWQALTGENVILPRNHNHPSESSMDDELRTALESDNVIPLRVVQGENQGGLIHPKLSLANVLGLSRVKSFLRAELARPQQRVHDGMLFYGPPRCGKTFLGQVMAGEMRAAFLLADIREIAYNWNAWGERRLREVFRTVLNNQPSVLFLDEVDIQRPGENESDNLETVVFELAAQLDRLAGSNAKVKVLAAATVPWNVHPDLVRPGRFSQVLLVLPPDPPARVAILRHHLQEAELAEDIDLTWLATNTDGYSGADLARLCEIAIELARQEPPRRVVTVTMANMKKARDSVRPSAAAWLDAAVHHAMLAEASGLYDDLLMYLHNRNPPRHRT